MERVLEECDRASVTFAPDPVHDLRVALRRCRSVADGLMAIDPNPAWKQMKKAGKRLFSSLGELRDMQVMEEWVHTLDTPDDPVTSALLNFLAGEESKFKQQAAQALQEFDRKQWRKWCRLLPRRAKRFRAGSAIFQHLALERWTQGYSLHQRALRNRSQVAWHSLRIGIKRFRYIIENFLPEQHQAWSADLKEMQDLLGDVHDLDVLWATALDVNAFPDAESKTRWHNRIIEERERRVSKYRDKMVGPTGLWHVWRETLPKGKQIQAIGLRRLKAWASVLDPDFKHSNHVTRLALQLYDGLAANGRIVGSDLHSQRTILQLAALMHDVGRSEQEKGHHKDTYRLIRQLPAPLGYNEQTLKIAAVVARYHRGALPRGGQKALQGLSLAERQEATRLAGILRLANAFDANQDGRIQKLKVHEQNGFLVIGAQGYSSRDRLAENIAAARHLLEIVYRRPIMLKPLRQPKIA
jgi:exopolyphosphatase/guanosine-5'-triphosphate,3'-diphosphate pyrophosphatase